MKILTAKKLKIIDEKTDGKIKCVKNNQIKKMVTNEEDILSIFDKSSGSNEVEIIPSSSQSAWAIFNKLSKEIKLKNDSKFCK